MHDNRKRTIWRVLVGERGDQLEVFTAHSGPFPPAPEQEGYIAIGWAGVGDMKMYKDNL